MTPRIAAISALLLAVAVVPSCLAQQPAAAPAARPQAPLQIPEPHYATVPMSIDVNAPADKVWARVGKFCDIGEWSPAADGSACRYLAGSGDMGTVRSVVNEVLVSKTPYSYTYTQAPRENTPYNLYHGTLQVLPLTPTTSRLDYVLFFDTSTLPDDAARTKYLKDRETTFNQRLRNMKILAEGGKLPPPAPAAPRDPSAPPRATPAPYASPNPTYVTVPMQIDINASVDSVWARLGHFCDISNFGAGFPACTILAGTDGEYGAIRSVGHEVLVGKTKYSHTYTQPMRATGFYSLYHGTVEARAAGPNKSTLFWTLVYDNSNLPDDAAKQKDISNRRDRFNALLRNIKTVCEGGTLPPPVTPAK